MPKPKVSDSFLSISFCFFTHWLACSSVSNPCFFSQSTTAGLSLFCNDETKFAIDRWALSVARLVLRTSASHFTCAACCLAFSTLSQAAFSAALLASSSLSSAALHADLLLMRASLALAMASPLQQNLWVTSLSCCLLLIAPLREQVRESYCWKLNRYADFCLVLHLLKGNLLALWL